MRKIPVFLISDENYAPYMAVTIASVVANTKEFINFYILDGGIEEQTKNRIASLGEKFKNFSLEYLEMDLKRFSGFPKIKHFSINTYFRYLIPELKPELDKVVYLDVDMVMRGDIAELYDEDLQGYPLAAVPYLQETPEFEKYNSWTSRVKNTFSMQTSHKYFNSGMLVMDCRFMREHNMVKAMLDKTEELKDVLECPDQDVLNILFINNYLQLSFKYNVVIDILVECNSRNICIDDIFLLHYTGGKGCRPWTNMNCPWSDDFWKYAALTEFNNQLQWRLLQKEFFALSQDVQILKNKSLMVNKILAKITLGATRKHYNSLVKEAKDHRFLQKAVEFKKILG